MVSERFYSEKALQTISLALVSLRENETILSLCYLKEFINYIDIKDFITLGSVNNAITSIRSGLLKTAEAELKSAMNSFKSFRPLKVVEFKPRYKD